MIPRPWGPEQRRRHKEATELKQRQQRQQQRGLQLVSRPGHDRRDETDRSRHVVRPGVVEELRVYLRAQPTARRESAKLALRNAVQNNWRIAGLSSLLHEEVEQAITESVESPRPSPRSSCSSRALAGGSDPSMALQDQQREHRIDAGAAALGRFSAGVCSAPSNGAEATTDAQSPLRRSGSSAAPEGSWRRVVDALRCEVEPFGQLKAVSGVAIASRSPTPPVSGRSASADGHRRLEELRRAAEDTPSGEVPLPDEQVAVADACEDAAAPRHAESLSPRACHSEVTAEDKQGIATIGGGEKGAEADRCRHCLVVTSSTAVGAAEDDARTEAVPADAALESDGGDEQGGGVKTSGEASWSWQGSDPHDDSQGDSESARGETDPRACVQALVPANQCKDLSNHTWRWSQTAADGGHDAAYNSWWSSSAWKSASGGNWWFGGWNNTYDAYWRYDSWHSRDSAVASGDSSSREAWIVEKPEE